MQVWGNDVLDLLDQCIRLPGEISQFTLHQLQQSCWDRGCPGFATLDQLQRILRIGGRAESVVELFLQRLDELGLKVSSPWTPNCGQFLVEALWQQLSKVWKEKNGLDWLC